MKRRVLWGAVAVTIATRFRRANFVSRYEADGGHASTGWSDRYRSR